MKLYLLFIIALILNQSLHSQQFQKDSFSLVGKIQGIDRGVIYLSYYADHLSKSINDSAIVVDGNFAFKGTVKGPTVAFISLNPNGGIDSNATNIFLEPNHLTVSVKVNEFPNATLTGSKTQWDYEQLRGNTYQLLERYKEPWTEYLLNKPGVNSDSLEVLLQPMYDSIKLNDYAYFDTHPQSYLTAYMLQNYSRELSADSLYLFYSRLGHSLQQSIIGKSLSERLIKKKAGSVGSIAKHFSATDVNGNYLVFPFLKGKYVLLDFWASWCVPCRKENPMLMELYRKYKSTGWVFIAISSDTDSNLWRTAIKKDKIEEWNHIQRQIYKEGDPTSNIDMDLSLQYDVSTLPTLFLINPQGIIIGRYKDVEKLEQALKRLF